MIDVMLCIFYHLQFFKSVLSEAPQHGRGAGRTNSEKLVNKASKSHLRPSTYLTTPVLELWSSKDQLTLLWFSVCLMPSVIL